MACWRPSQGKIDTSGSAQGIALFFCKAANAGCRTPISYIKDAAGCINVPFLKLQRQYKIMLEKGWEFTQLPWQVEAAWPTSPDVLQRALNATSEVHSSVTELEGAVTIAECLETGMSEPDAVEAASSGNPLWTSYAKVLAELAQRYGGGHQVPLLHKLDTFSKKHGENRRLGEEFLGAVVSSFKYPDPSINLPRVVDMLLTTNMVAPKVVDGVARCITKSDVTALSTAKKAASPPRDRGPPRGSRRYLRVLVEKPPQHRQRPGWRFHQQRREPRRPVQGAAGRVRDQQGRGDIREEDLRVN